jgi:hypothetical protein
MKIENVHIYLNSLPRRMCNPASAPATGTPAIGAAWPGIDGIYAGIARGEDDRPDAHLVLLNERPEKLMDWPDAMALAEQRTDGARLPTRFESALLYAHLRDQFDTSEWHWTGTQYSAGSAWDQFFYYGTQHDNGKTVEARVRLVRRFIRVELSSTGAGLSGLPTAQARQRQLSSIRGHA